MSDINIWSVIISAVVGIVISSFWFSPLLFGNAWIKLSGFKPEDIEEAKAKGMKGMWKQYTVQIITSLISMVVLAFAIAISGASNSPLSGAFVGFIIWLGFVATIHTQEMIWLKKDFKLTLIDTGNSLVALVVAGLILGM